MRGGSRKVVGAAFRELLLSVSIYNTSRRNCQGFTLSYLYVTAEIDRSIKISGDRLPSPEPKGYRKRGFLLFHFNCIKPSLDFPPDWQDPGDYAFFVRF